MLSIATVFGTRPEIIKLAPVISACDEAGFKLTNIFTGQHLDIGAPFLQCFGIDVQRTTPVMADKQSISSLVSKSIVAVDSVLAEIQPDVVVVQGDTASTLAGALSAQFLQIPVVHVEAGLRSGSFAQPFPEEINRSLITRLSSLHCAPTNQNVENLLAEGVPHANIVQTGNPIVDAIARISANLNPSEAIRRRIESLANQKIIVATTHRRENFGARLDGYLEGLKRFILANDDVTLLYPVHPNPNVQLTADRHFASEKRALLMPPLAYPDFLYLMSNADLIISDSGGIQEEAASIGVPLLVLRESTERPEAVDAQTARLVPDPSSLHDEIQRTMWGKSKIFVKPAENPFGDGDSGRRIADAIADHFAELKK